MYCSEKLIFASGGESNYRIPSVIVTNRGTVLAFSNDRKYSVSDHAEEMALVMCRKPNGGEWQDEKVLLSVKGVACIIGSAVYDSETDEAFIFFRRCFVKKEFVKYTDEDRERMKREDELRAREIGIEIGDFFLKSSDDGLTWTEERQTLIPTPYTYIDGRTCMAEGFTHGAAHGIQLRYGEHRGRLLCPSRIFEGSYADLSEIHTHVYNNAIYSDDHGKTWHASAPVQIGTGEGTLIERGDGSILYNSRAYFKDGKRYIATSTDGGATYSDFRTDPFLIEESNMGCNASFLRVSREELGTAAALLPEGADSITVFVNPRAEIRQNMTACISFDEGESWRVARTFCEGRCSYSSLAFSPENKMFCLEYEKGNGKDPCALGVAAVEFDLEWLLS